MNRVLTYGMLTDVLQPEIFFGWDGVAECWSDVGSSMAQVVFLTETNSAGRAPELFAPRMPIGGYRVDFLVVPP